MRRAIAATIAAVTATGIGAGLVPAAHATTVTARTALHRTTVAVGQPTHASVTPNGTVTLSGSVRDATAGKPGVRRALHLELKTASGWVTRATGATNATGGYTLRVPTYWYGHHTWRVVAPATRTAAAGASSARAVTVTVPYKARGKASSHTFMQARVVRWNPCQVIPYRVNLNGGPAETMAVVKASFAKLTAATGIRFADKGTTSAIPFAAGKRGQLAAGITIAWTRVSTVSGLAGTAVGLGGSTWTTRPTAHYIDGGVALDKAFPLPKLSSTSSASVKKLRTNLIESVVLHELGHVMGLGHVNDRQQVMNPVDVDGWTTYGAGDLAGLARLGLDQGCL
ncbi:matrixin family metalloprotease [Nocardioides sp. DS6]|uniref:Matrixin family metalloprotease n=1 Tax=Nocardioides eburneus TaxID=3231482 RepID=A0ABV3SV40_9ACTN